MTYQATFTVGHRTVDRLGDTVYHVLSIDKKIIATFEHYADACLDAAAPDLLEALQAIRARLIGEFDHPALVKFGALTTTDGDIGSIVEAALAKVKS